MPSPKIAFRREHTGTRVGDGLQRLAQDVADRVNASPVLDSRLIDAEQGQPAGSALVFEAAMPRSIPHGLGRPAVGWLETYGADAVVAGRVNLFPTAHPTGTTSATHVTVTATNTGRCFLLVF